MDIDSSFEIKKIRSTLEEIQSCLNRIVHELRARNDNDIALRVAVEKTFKEDDEFMVGGNDK